MKWIREPVALFEIKTSKTPPEPLTTYAGRYELASLAHNGVAVKRSGSGSLLYLVVAR